MMPVTTVGTVVLGELVAGGLVTNMSDKWVRDLAAQGSSQSNESDCVVCGAGEVVVAVVSPVV